MEELGGVAPEEGEGLQPPRWVTLAPPSLQEKIDIFLRIRQEKLC